MVTVSHERERRGALGEELAARFLELEGCLVLGRRVRVADVEVDVLVRDAACLVVVEVKVRSNPLLPAADALRPRQLARLRRAAEVLLERHRDVSMVRVDVVSIDWQRGRDHLRMQRLRGVQAS